MTRESMLGDAEADPIVSRLGPSSNSISGPLLFALSQHAVWRQGCYEAVVRKTSRAKRPKQSGGAARRKFESEIARIVQNLARSGVAQSKPALRDSRTLEQATLDFQRGFVFEALQQHASTARWNISATAERLDVSRSYLYRLIEELGLEQIRADRIRAERSLGRRP